MVHKSDPVEFRRLHGITHIQLVKYWGGAQKPTSLAPKLLGGGLKPSCLNELTPMGQTHKVHLINLIKRPTPSDLLGTLSKTYGMRTSTCSASS